MSTLADLLGDSDSQEERPNGFLAKYGLGRNPFPPARTIYPEVIYNQEPALKRFATSIKPVIGGEVARRAMAVIGGTGGGKSHFLRHCQYHVERLNKGILTVEFLAGTTSAANLVRELLRSADDHTKRQGEQDFLTAIVNALRTDENFGPIHQSDLRSCLGKLTDASKDGYTPTDMYQKYNFDLLREVGRRWLAGGTLTQTERNHLKVSSRLATASLMIRVVSELLAFARERGIVRGVLLCLDEVEALFTSGASTAKIQAFLQDVRYLFDEAVGRESGYGLMVVSASTQTGTANLRDFNYPLFQRLGFEQEAREPLHQIESAEEGRAFVNVYLDFERKRFQEEGPGRTVTEQKTRSIVTDLEIESALYGAQRQTTPTSQARFLEELHRLIEQKKLGAGL